MKIESLEEAMMVRALTENFCKQCPHYSLYSLEHNISSCNDCFADKIERLANESYTYWKKVENDTKKDAENE